MGKRKAAALVPHISVCRSLTMISRLVMTADMGYVPPVNAFAIVIISGWMFQCWCESLDNANFEPQPFV